MTINNSENSNIANKQISYIYGIMDMKLYDKEW